MLRIVQFLPESYHTYYIVVFAWFQSLQGKQDSLLQRLDELDQENEEMRQSVAELEEEKEDGGSLNWLD